MHGRSMDRRRFIQGSAAGVGAGAAGAAAVALNENDALPAPREALSVLDDVTFGVLVCFAHRLFPSGQINVAGVAHSVDSALRHAHPEVQADVRLALQLLENGLVGVFTRSSLRLFSKLGPEAQDRAIDAWSRSYLEPIRAAAASLRKLCYGACYAQLAHAEQIGYPGPLFEKGRPEPIRARAALSKPYVLRSPEGDGSASP